MAVAILAVSCTTSDSPPDESAAAVTTVPGLIGSAFVLEVADVVRAHAYYADRMNDSAWDAAAGAAGDRLDASVYRSVDRLLLDLGDHHSALFRPHEIERDQAGALAAAPVAVLGDVSTLTLPSVTLGPQTEGGRRYIELARTALEAGAGACGWILDLRENGGGNLFTMMAAVAPLLGVGPSVRYRDRNGDLIEYSIDETGAVVDGEGSVLASAVPGSSIDAPVRPIAVLQGLGTVSSAEALVLALRGREGSRSFGMPSGGLPTGNELYSLSDGSTLNLTVAVGVDSAGTSYERAVAPDEPVAPGDEAEAARLWLEGQAACGA